MQTIPTPPPETPDALGDGFALLAYTLREGHAPIGLPSYRLDRAARAAVLAGARRDDEHPAMIARLADATRAIGSAYRRAVALEAEPPQRAPGSAQTDDHDGSRPEPRRPLPNTQPPANGRQTPQPVGGRTIAF